MTAANTHLILRQKLPCCTHHTNYGLGSVLLSNQRPGINRVGYDSTLCQPIAKTFRLLDTEIGQTIIVICKQSCLAMANYQKRTHSLQVPSSGELALHLNRFSCMLLCLKQIDIRGDSE
jgi:hypothetical protein